MTENKELPSGDISQDVVDAALGDITPEYLAGLIRDLVLASRRSRRNRQVFGKQDLPVLCSWERELTENYGVARKANR